MNSRVAEYSIIYALAETGKCLVKYLHHIFYAYQAVYQRSFDAPVLIFTLSTRITPQTTVEMTANYDRAHLN
jgi:hypothetical protein